MMKETSVGRVIVNEIVPAEVGYLNTIISKKALRDIISDVIKAVGVARACEFLDGIKNLGYYMAVSYTHLDVYKRQALVLQNCRLLKPLKKHVVLA